MAGKGGSGSAVGGIPDLHQFVITARSDVLAIGRPCHSKDEIGVTVVGEEVVTPIGVEELDGFVFTGGGDALTIR